MNETEDKPFRILMVEDDDLDFELSLHAAGAAGLRESIDRVNTAEAALERLTNGGPRPDLVLLDLRLPGMDGPEALERLKADPVTRGIPVIILTSSDDEREINRSYAAGASAFLSKPRGIEAYEEVFHAIGGFWRAHVRFPGDR